MNKKIGAAKLIFAAPIVLKLKLNVTSNRNAILFRKPYKKLF